MAKLGEEVIEKDPFAWALFPYLHEQDHKNEARVLVFLQELHQTLTQFREELVNNLKLA